MKWCLQCGKPNDILNETCEECDNPNFYDPNAKAGDAEIKSLRAERDNLAAANAELREALVPFTQIPVMESAKDNEHINSFILVYHVRKARAVLAKGAK